MTEKKFDLSKPVRTRAGYPARIICTDRVYLGVTGAASWPILALYVVKGNEATLACQANGQVSSKGDSPYDLVNVPDIRYEYQNVYSHGTRPSCRYKTLELMETMRAEVNRLGYLKYTFEDDELKSVEFIRD